MSARPYDVVIWGTTGVVGRLVAEHIARDYQASATYQGLQIRWSVITHLKTMDVFPFICPSRFTRDTRFLEVIKLIPSPPVANLARPKARVF